MQILVVNFKKILFTIHMILDIFSIEAVEITTINKSEDAKICGTVQTLAGKRVILREGVTLSPEEFQNVYFKKLSNAWIVPESGCEIHVCGVNAVGKPLKPGYIGTTSDNTGCRPYSTKSQVAEYNYGSFNTSSISCGCKKSNFECRSGCSQTSNDLRETWKDTDCAVLFEESGCKSCYFQPIYLSKNETYSTDNSHHITSLIARDGCVVHHDLPAFARMWRFRKEKLPRKYVFIQGKIISAYQNYPETFNCVCEEVQVPPPPPPLLVTIKDTTRPPGTTSSPFNKSSTMPSHGEPSGGGKGNGAEVILGITTVVLIIGSIGVVGLVILRRKQNVTSVVAVETTGITNESEDHAAGTQGHIDNQLKFEKKLDNVRRLLELLCNNSLGNEQEIPALNPMIEGHEESKIFGLLNEQFQEVCQPDNILSRSTIHIIDKERPLGIGQFGTVYKGLLNHEPVDGLQEVVAIKIMRLQGSMQEKENVRKSFVREIQTFESVGAGNENIVRFLGACCHIDGLFILTQFCEGGSLKEHLVNVMRPLILVTPQVVTDCGDSYSGIDSVAEQKQIEENRNAYRPQVIQWCAQIASGMEWLSEKGIIHGDLAARNVLLSDEGIAKICDFGLSRKCVNVEDYAHMLDKFPYNSLAPELCRDGDTQQKHKLSVHVDKWAFGCTGWEICSLGASLYPDMKEKETCRLVKVMRLLSEGYRHPKPDLATDDVYKKFKECWNEVPEKRPNFSELRLFFENCKVQAS